jgi:hypothetical protein
MSTQKQIDANRMNAQKSTGPRTPEGKAVVGQNAVTHGLLARSSIISGGVGREDVDELTVILEGLYESRHPVGHFEEMLVEDIAVARLNQSRAAKFEVGAIRRNRDSMELQRREDLQEAVDVDLELLHRDGDPYLRDTGNGSARLVTADSPLVARTKIRRRLRQNPFGVRHLHKTMVDSIEEVERTGKLNAEWQQRLENEFWDGEQSLAARVLEISSHKASRLSPKDQAAMLALLREELAGLETLLVTVDNRQQEIEEAAMLEASIPSSADIEKLHRYGSPFNRKSSQAVLQLDRAQRQRMEEERFRAKEVEAAQSAVARPIDLNAKASEPDQAEYRKEVRSEPQDLDVLPQRTGSTAGDPPCTEVEGSAMRAIRESSVGIRHLIDTVDGAMSELASTNELSGPRLRELELEFAEPDSSLSARINALGKRINGQCTFPRPSLGTARTLLQREKEGLEALLVSVTIRAKEVGA